MAVTFTGSSYLSVASVPASQNFKSAPLSLAIWVFPTSSGGTLLSTGGDEGVYCGIVGSGTSGSQFTDCASIQNSVSSGTWFYDIEQASFTDEAAIQGDATTTNAWVHYAATFDGTSGTAGFKLYKNGAAITPGSTSNTLAATVAWNRVIVGGFNGDAQDAWIFNRALAANEIAELYRNRLTGISLTGLVAHYPLFNGGNAGVDWSGNGRNLTATGTVVDASRNAPVSRWGTSPNIIIPNTGTTVTGNSSGTTNTTGASNVQIGAATSGTTQTSGSSAVAIGASSAGTTQTTGSSAVQIQATTTGTTQTSGASSVQIQAASSGLTQFTGVSTAQISGGGGAVHAPQGPERRWSDAGGMRRIIRR